MFRTTLIILSLLFVNLTNSFAEGDLSFLKKEMPYMEARDLLLKNGWKPFSFDVESNDDILPKCLLRQGSEYCLSKESNRCNEVRNRCSSVPELESCGARGYCMMIMGKGDKQLFITILGDIGRLNTDEDPIVTGWRFDEWEK